MIDAKKNSVSMAAQSVYSHKTLLNKGTNEKIGMLKEKGIDWYSYPNFFRVGSFFRRQIIDMPITEEERNNIPEKYRPKEGMTVKRSKVLEDVPEKVTWDWLIK